MSRIETLAAERNALAADLTYVRSCLDADDVADDAFESGLEFCRTAADDLAVFDSKIDQLEAIGRAAADPRNVTSGDAPTVIVKRDLPDVFDTRDIGPMTSRADLTARARTAVEQIAHVDDDIREAATRSLENVVDKRGDLALRMLYTGSDAYRSAFQKVLAGNTYGLNDSERDAMSRAASLTDGDGGFAVPFTLDPTIMLTGGGVVNAIRQLARVVQTTTDTWNGLSTAGVTASYDAEASEVSDDAPTLTQPTITTRMARAFVPFSIEIGQDWPGMEGDIRTLILDAKDTLEAQVFWSGAAGSNQPIGIETALTGVTASMVAPLTPETFVVADIARLYAAVPPRQRASASMAAVGEFSTIAEMRRLLAAAGDRSSFNEATASMPSTLYGWPFLEHSTADAWSAVDNAATATNHLIIAGDWSQYVIVDRIGLSVELIPHLFATANNRPSGQRGFFASWRNGADSVNDAAFRVLRSITAA